MIRLVLCFILTLCLTCIGTEKYRGFTRRNGKTIRAKLVSFDSESGKITLEQENGRRAVVIPSVFGEHDQEYIQEWITDFQFADIQNYSISATKNTSPFSSNRPRSGGPFSGFYEVSYTINITNKSGVDFGNVRIEYCFFIAKKGCYRKAEGVMRCDTRSYRQGQLKLSNTAEFETDKIKISHRSVEYYEDAGSRHVERPGREEITGLIVRVYREGNDDIFLEFSEPKAFRTKYKWNEFPQRDGIEEQGVFESRDEKSTL